MRRAAIALCLCLLVSVSGCWDNMDIRSRAVVLGMAVDLSEDGRFLLCLQLPVAGEGEPGQVPREAMLVCGTGDTLSRAMAGIQTRLSRDLFLGQLQAIIMSEQVAQRPELVAIIIDDLLRDPFIDRKAVLFVSRCDAADVLRAQPPIQPVASLSIGLEHQQVRTNLLHPRTELWEFLVALETPGQCPMAVGVDASEDQIELSGVALFDCFGMVGWLGPYDTRGLMWLIGQGSYTTVTVRTANGPVDVIVDGTRTRVRVIPGDTPHLSYRVSGEAMLVVAPGTGRLTQRDVREIEQAVAHSIRGEALRAVDRMRELNADAAGIGRQIYYRSPRQWDGLDWEEDFRRTRVDVTVTIPVNRRGALD